MRYDLAQIDTFLTVMEVGSITAAAARLNLSKSVVSKRVSDFEAALGAALFRRNAGRIAPTEAGIRLAERLRPALGELVAAAESAAWGGDGTRLHGTLAISAPTSFGTMFLSPIFARFAAAHPGLELRIEYDDHLRDLAREGFDIGIRVGDARDSALMQRKLCEGGQVIVASPAYLSRHGTPQDITDLGDHQVIGYTHVPNAQLWRLRKGGQAVTAPVSCRLTLNNGEAIRDMAIAGLGLAILPCFIAAAALADGRLVPVLADFATRSLPVLAVWPPITPTPAKLRALIDHLHNELAGGAPWARQDARTGK